MLEKFFHLKENHTDVKTEIMAGITTFMTMAYILAVNPNILSAAGMDSKAVLIATALASFIATALMAVLANYPFALAPGMGLNAYFAYTVVLTMGYSWQLALMAVFVEGVIFIALSLTNVREGIFNAIPMTLKSAVSVGIGLFVAFVGLQNAKLIVNSDSTLVTYQHFKGATFHSVGVGAILALLGVVITAILLVKRVKGGILYGILITWLLGIVCELTGIYVPDVDAGMYSVIPTAFVSFDFSALGETFGQVFKTDFSGVGLLNFFAVMFSFLFVDLFDTLGTLIGVASKADMLDEDGRLPNIKGALMADSIGTCVGAVLAVCLVLAAGWLVDAGVITDARAYYSLIALTPAIFFATILASFRGYFQGHQLMTPPAVSQIVEQFIRVVTMVVLAYVLLPYGLEYAAAGAAFGAVPGSLTGLVVMGCFYRYYRKQWQTDAVKMQAPAAELVRSSTLIKRLLLLALPVSCANILVPVTSSIDVLLVPGRLIDSGLSVEQATAQFGYLAGMAQPLLLMATIPTMSLATSLVPAVSEAFALNKWQIIGQKAATAMKLCCLITVPASVGMWVLAEPISLLLYGTAKAGIAIMHSAPAICLLGLQQVTTGMLQGMGHTNLPMLNMLFGIAAKLVAVCQLTNAEYGITGAAWATNINFGLTALLNIIALYKLSIRFSWLSIAKIIAAAAVMGAVAVEVHMLLGGASALATIAAMLAAGISYIILLPLLGVLSRQELCQLPVVKRFLK